MPFFASRRVGGIALVLTGLLGGLATGQESNGTETALNQSLTFSASFEKGMDADLGGGDLKIYHASSAKRNDPKPGLPADEWQLAAGQGRGGGQALRFVKKSTKVAFFRAKGNIDYRVKDFGGTISFWLNLDPNQDLGDWYCDPIQITEKAWNDGAIWVDFTKSDKPKHFRLGVLADLAVWNPGKDLDFDKLPPGTQPAVVMKQSPFARGRWTHVAITFDHFNTGRPDGIATLHLDGKAIGSVSARKQQFTWDPDKAAIQIGMGYVGLFDDLQLFNRALTSAEIAALPKFTPKPR